MHFEFDQMWDSSTENCNVFNWIWVCHSLCWIAFFIGNCQLPPFAVSVACTTMLSIVMRTHAFQNSNAINLCCPQHSILTSIFASFCNAYIHILCSIKSFKQTFSVAIHTHTWWPVHILGKTNTPQNIPRKPQWRTNYFNEAQCFRFAAFEPSTKLIAQSHVAWLLCESSAPTTKAKRNPTKISIQALKSW